MDNEPDLELNDRVCTQGGYWEARDTGDWPGDLRDPYGASPELPPRQEASWLHTVLHRKP